MERKSLSDLRQSFASGRLYHQAEAMCRHYAAPVLLIEFERDRAFALHAASELGSDPQARPCDACSCAVSHVSTGAVLAGVWGYILHTDNELVRSF